MSIQGNIKEVRSLTEPLQLARDNGVKRALVPIENKRQFLEVSGDIMEHVDPVFYGVDFSDIILCRRVLLAIADDPRLLIDNDHGVVLTGTDFVHVLRSRPEWDWRRDRVS